MIKIAPSLACADMMNFQEDLDCIIAAKPDLLHFDIMDGMFVPNFSLNFDLLKLIKTYTDIPVDVHLMVEDSDRFIPQLLELGADIIIFHYEAVRHHVRALRQVRMAGKKAGIALNPGTDPACLHYLLDDLDIVTVMTVDPGFAGQKLIPSTFGKIKKVREMIRDSNKDIDILIDGQVNETTARDLVANGANILVIGSSGLFKYGQERYKEIIDGYRALAGS